MGFFFSIQYSTGLQNKVYIDPFWIIGKQTLKTLGIVFLKMDAAVKYSQEHFFLSLSTSNHFFSP